MQQIALVLILGVIAVGAVAFPVLVGYARYDDTAELETDIRRYRDALAAGTVCPRCRYANSTDARFCADCGRELDPEAGG